MAHMSWSKRLEMTFGLCALGGLALLFGLGLIHAPLHTRIRAAERVLLLVGLVGLFALQLPRWLRRTRQGKNSQPGSDHLG